MQNDITEILGASVVSVDPPTEEEIVASYADGIWLDQDKLKVNENVFGRLFRDVYHLQYQNGLFYTKDGKMTEEFLSKEIWETIADIGIASDVEKTVKKLVGAVKLASTVRHMEMDPNVIPYNNGDFHVREWEFRLQEYGPVPYRLAAYLPLEFKQLPYFSKWLKDLFYDEDVPTLQEYLGYCLVPSTKGQKALFLVGEGGTGKSGLGCILEGILGDAMINVANTQEFLQDKFKLAELEHKLVLYDDDLGTEALEDSGLYKKLITNSIAITADRKYGQPFKFVPQIKIVACCNQMLVSPNDMTSGFYRRLLPIVCKPLAKDFVPDPRFYDHLREEAPSIAAWAMLGLHRLVKNNWVLSESERSQNYLKQKQELENPYPAFMDSCFDFDPSYPGLSSVEIHNLYNAWCVRNDIKPESGRKLQLWLSDNATKYGIRASHNIISGDHPVRGYRGLLVREKQVKSTRIQLT